MAIQLQRGGQFSNELIADVLTAISTINCDTTNVWFGGKQAGYRCSVTSTTTDDGLTWSVLEIPTDNGNVAVCWTVGTYKLTSTRYFTKEFKYPRRFANNGNNSAVYASSLGSWANWERMGAINCYPTSWDTFTLNVGDDGNTTKYFRFFCVGVLDVGG